MKKIEIEEYDFTRAVMLLDASVVALNEAAAREKVREAGKSLRCITHQERAKTVKHFVKEMSDKYGIYLDWWMTDDD